MDDWCSSGAGPKVEVNSRLRMRKSLTKAEILRDRRDISRLFSGSHAFRTNGLHLRIVENDLGWSRVVFAAVRSFRTAVERNRSRRRVREAYRNIKERITGHYDIVFVMYPGDFSYAERYQQVEKLLRRSGAIPDQ